MGRAKVAEVERKVPIVIWRRVCDIQTIAQQTNQKTAKKIIQKKLGQHFDNELNKAVYVIK